MNTFNQTYFRDKTNFTSTKSWAKPDRYIADRQASITDLTKGILLDAQIEKTTKPSFTSYQESLYAAADLQPGKRLLQFNSCKQERMVKRVKHVKESRYADFVKLEAASLLIHDFNQPIALSSKSSIAAIVNQPDDNPVQVWTKKESPYSLPFLKLPFSVSFAGESENVVTGGPDEQVRIWDLENLKNTQTITTQFIPTLTATNQNLILSGSYNGRVCLIDPRKKDPTSRFDTTQRITALALSSNYFATAGMNSDNTITTIKFRDLRNPVGNVFVSHEQTPAPPIHALQFNPSNYAQIVTSGGEDQNELRIYDLNRSSLIAAVATGLPILNGFWSGNGDEIVTLHNNISEKTGCYKTWRFDTHPSSSLEALQSVDFLQSYHSPWHAAINPSQGTIALEALDPDNNNLVILFWNLFKPMNSKPMQPNMFASFERQIR